MKRRYIAYLVLNIVIGMCAVISVVLRILALSYLSASQNEEKILNFQNCRSKTQIIPARGQIKFKEETIDLSRHVSNILSIIYRLQSYSLINQHYIGQSGQAVLPLFRCLHMIDNAHLEPPARFVHMEVRPRVHPVYLAHNHVVYNKVIRPINDSLWTEYFKGKL